MTILTNWLAKLATCGSTTILLLVPALMIMTGCERDLDDLEPATFPTNGDVFLDGFSSGLQYAAFGGSVPTAFQVDTDIRYRGSASMRVDVPDFEDPRGAYAGGAYFLESGRDLSGYTALTFWMRSSQSAHIDVLGIGNYLGGNEYVATINQVPVNTEWKKYYIPIPDPARLTQERGMFFFSEGNENGRGYSFWIDDVQFEDLGTVVPEAAGIFNREDRVVAAENGDVFSADGFVDFSLPDGTIQRVNTAPAYFEFSSSDAEVASVSATGLVTVLSAGTAVITATLGGQEVEGSLTVNSTGAGVGPLEPAPVPDEAEENVISLYSNAYTDEPVDFYNGYWEFSTTQSEEIQVQGDDIIKYTQLNFVGIQFTSPTIDIRDMTHLHLDIWTPDATQAPNEFKVLLFDLGPDNSFEGNDNSSHELTITSPTLQSNTWVSLDIPLSDFAGLTGRANLAQVVLSGSLPTVFLDNLYLYEGESGGGSDDEPMTAAPEPPARDAADVISLFSDAYNDVTVETFRTDWSQAGLEDFSIDGNAVLKYAALAFVGIETALPANQLDITGMTHVHFDIWTPNATSLGFKIVDWGADGGFDGGDDTEHELVFDMPAQGQWVSYDIPLEDFSGLATQQNVAQYIFSAQPAAAATLYVDNLYFYHDDGGGSGATEPQTAPDAPTRDAASVISLFSDAYSDVPVDTWRTEWSDAVYEEVTLAANPVKKYSALNFVGVETVMNQIDLSGMTHIHVDVWSPDFTAFEIKLVDFGADGAFAGGDDTEATVLFDSPATGQWLSLDIPLSDFEAMTGREHFAQLIFVGRETNNNTVFIDNVYFYNNN